MHDFDSDLTEYLLKQGHSVFVENITDLPKEEFANARHMGFGASDSSKLLDVNPFNTREDLVNEKVNRTHDESIDKKSSVRKGAELEFIILAKGGYLLEDMGLVKNNFILKPNNMYGNKENHLTVNFDGVLMDNHNEIVTVAEAKLVTKYGKKYYNFNKAFIRTKDGTADLEYTNDLSIPETPLINEFNVQDMCNKLADYYGIPVYYYTQVQQQLYFLDKPFGYLVVQDDDNWETYIFKIHKNDSIIEVLKKQAVKSWALVEAKREIKKERP